MKYAVETKVYDSGRVEMSGPIEVRINCMSISECRANYDYYYDVFDSKKEALDFIDENKES